MLRLGPAPDPAGELTALPQTLELDLRDLLLRAGQGRGEGEETGQEGPGGEKVERKEKGGRKGKGSYGHTDTSFSPLRALIINNSFCATLELEVGISFKMLQNVTLVCTNT